MYSLLCASSHSSWMKNFPFLNRRFYSLKQEKRNKTKDSLYKYIWKKKCVVNCICMYDSYKTNNAMFLNFSPLVFRSYRMRAKYDFCWKKEHLQHFACIFHIKYIQWIGMHVFVCWFSPIFLSSHETNFSSIKIIHRLQTHER